ncbi:hypothetical protein EDB89DRAFT_1904277 [Lactarius sanguifluus]|nr:hypothetical protein EDB89DRAFT_1904277 [Lactarius sanguifluus]
MVFAGSNEYLEDFVARVDTPHPNRLQIQYLDQLDFQVPQSLRSQLIPAVACKNVIYLYIKAVGLLSYLQDNIAWVEPLRPFTAVDTLHSVEPALKAATEAMGLLRLRVEVTKFLAVRWDCGRVIGELTRKDTIPKLSCGIDRTASLSAVVNALHTVTEGPSYYRSSSHSRKEPEVAP